MSKPSNGKCATCGNPLYRKPSHWKNGYAAYCGASCRSETRARDLTGTRFGKLTAICREGSDNFGNARWRCLCDCGKTSTPTSVRLVSGKTKSCGCIAYNRGSSAVSWKNGKTLTPDGYVRIRDSVTGKVLGMEHVVVMTSIIGRPLFPGESVHHRNGIRSDNTPENLELKASNHGKGQSIEDLVAWAKEILKRYGGDC